MTGFSRRQVLKLGATGLVGSDLAACSNGSGEVGQSAASPFFLALGKGIQAGGPAARRQRRDCYVGQPPRQVRGADIGRAAAKS